MARRIDSYLKDLIPEEKFAFYETVRDFGDAEIAPHLLHWEREHRLVPDECIRKMGETRPVRPAHRRGSTAARAATTPTSC
jgi:alkylation response protein AidB-like acyl-CoA dehydrogenase